MGGELVLGQEKLPSPFELKMNNIGCSGLGRPT